MKNYNYIAKWTIPKLWIMAKILFCLFFSAIFGSSNANTQHGDDWRGALETRNSTWLTHEQMRRTDEETENKGNFLTPYSELITFTAVYVVQVFKNYDVDGSGTWEEEEIFEYVTDLLQVISGNTYFYHLGCTVKMPQV